MVIHCTICKSPWEYLENLSVAKCGHTFHSGCLKDVNSKSVKNINCRVYSCQSNIKEDAIIKILPIVESVANHVQQQSNAAVDQETDEEENQIICTICKEAVTDTNDISVIKCGHVSHYECAKRFVMRQMIKCPVTSCEEMMSYSAIIKIQVEDMQKNYQSNKKIKDKKGAKEDIPTIWKKVFNLIMEKFENPDKSISAEESGYLMEEIGELLCAEKWKQQPQCAKCDKNKLSTENLQKKITYITKQKAQCYLKNKALKNKNKILFEGGVSGIAELREDNAIKTLEIEKLRNNNKTLEQEIKTLQSETAKAVADLGQANDQLLEMNKLREHNEQMQQMIQTLQSEAATAVADLGQANEQLLEMNKLREHNEQMQQMVQTFQSEASTAIISLGQANEQLLEMNKLREQNEETQQIIQDLQSQVITTREEKILKETEIKELKTQNGALTKENEQIKIDLSTLKRDYESLDSTMSDFMISGLHGNIDNLNTVDTLYGQINSLQLSNDRLVQYNEELQKENDYRWELLMNTNSCNAFPGTSKVASEH